MKAGLDPLVSGETIINFNEFHSNAIGILLIGK